MVKWLNITPTVDGWQIIDHSEGQSIAEPLQTPSLLRQIDPENCFEYFFDEEILTRIADLTNISFQDYMKKKREKQTRIITDWYDTNNDELRKFIGVILMMGIDKRPEIRSNWKTQGLWSSNLIQKTLTGKRFESLNKFIEVGEKDSYNKLGRLSFLTNQFIQKSISIYKPNEKLSLDESLIAFKGRHILKQYMPVKPKKWGFKTFLLCESQTGYCLNLFLYNNDISTKYKPYYLTLMMLEEYANQGYQIFADNRYSSIDLAKNLKTRNKLYRHNKKNCV